MKIVFVVGARPNFVKAAPVINTFRKHSDLNCILVHTGQHFDKIMSDVFFKQLGIGEPDINLGIGGGSQSQQTAAIMIEMEKKLIEIKPDWVFVFGDVNSTLAATIVSKKLFIKVAHIESGLRSFDMEMPEEVNRVLTDRISDLLFITERSGVDNLINEGIHQDRIHIVGNTMIDCLIKMKSEIDKNQILEKLGLKEKGFIVVTLHRPSNVDKIDLLKYLKKKITKWSGDKKILWPIHPRIKQNELKIDKKKWYLSKPIGYIEFLKLVSKSFCVFTDSGGIQEETSFLGVKCFTLRENTERPVTCTIGTNVLLTSKLIKENKFFPIKSSNIKKIPSIPLWDGRSSERILKIFLSKN